MTNTKMLEKIIMVKKSLSLESQKDIDMLVSKNLDLTKTIGSVEAEIASVILQLKNDIASEEAKKNGKSNQLKVAKDILKRATKEALHYAKTINGNQYICDGFILVKFVNPFELPECPEKLEYINAESFIEIAKKFSEELIVPDKTKLKTYIKTQKAEHKGDKNFKGAVYNFGKNLPMFNAQFLVDAIECMDGEYKIFYKDTKTSVYFVDGFGNEVVLCPISKLYHRDKVNEDFIDEETNI